MEAKKYVEEIQKRIQEEANPENIIKLKRYFKEEIETAGLNAPKVKCIAKDFCKKLKEENDLNKVFDVAERLFITARMEEVSMAILIIRHFHNKYSPQVFSLFNQWSEYLTNWAHTDMFSTYQIADLIKKDNKVINKIHKWTRSQNRWKRRSSAVSLVMEARQGNHLPEVFKTATKLMKDEDVMVQKGVGWLLKEASKKHPKEVADFLIKWKNITTRLVLNYACEKMPKSLKKKVLA